MSTKLAELPVCELCEEGVATFWQESPCPCCGAAVCRPCAEGVADEWLEPIDPESPPPLWYCGSWTPSQREATT
jgi:hypothetical protein